MDDAQRVIHEVISAAATQMGLIAQRRMTRADIEFMIATTNAQTWPDALSHDDRLVAWDDETQTGAIERTVVNRPLPSDFTVTTDGAV